MLSPMHEFRYRAPDEPATLSRLHSNTGFIRLTIDNAQVSPGEVPFVAVDQRTEGCFHLAVQVAGRRLAYGPDPMAHRPWARTSATMRARSWSCTGSGGAARLLPRRYLSRNS